MSRIIIDLDHTLLDTTRFKMALAVSLGLTQSEWDMAYRKFVNDYGMFNPDDFLQGASQEQKEKFENVVRRLPTFLYPDSMTFIKKVTQAGHEVVLITFGDKSWQEKKLKALRESLETIKIVFVSSTEKLEHFKHLVINDTVMIDDNAVEIDTIKSRFQGVVVYWVCRPNGKYRDKPPSTPHTKVKSLAEITL